MPSTRRAHITEQADFARGAKTSEDVAVSPERAVFAACTLARTLLAPSCTAATVQ